MLLKNVTDPFGFLIPIRELFLMLTGSQNIVELTTPGQGFKCENGKVAAAVKIQSIWRMHADKKLHNWMVKARAMAKRCAETFLRNQALGKLRKSRAARMASLRKIVQTRTILFGSQWEGFLKNTRVIVHLASMNFQKDIRDSYTDQQLWATQQIGRLVDLLDPCVKIVFVTIRVGKYLTEYLMALISSAFDDETIQNRLKIVWVDRPSHFHPSVPLIDILLCNPAIQIDILNYIGNSRAYLVPSVTSDKFVELAYELDIPIMGSCEAVAQLGHNRIKQREFVESAGGTNPPGKIIRAQSGLHDDSIVYTTLHTLVQLYPEVCKWCFRISSEFVGRAVVCISTTNIQHLTVQELPAMVRGTVEFLIDTTWREFICKMLSSGGVIEAYQVQGQETGQSPISHLLIQPDGQIQVLGSSALICIQPHLVWGYMFPQKCCNNDTLMSEDVKIGTHFYQSGYIGYLTCEFMHVGLDVLWCTGIKPYVTESLSTFFMICMILHYPPQPYDESIYADMNHGQANTFKFFAKSKFLDSKDAGDRARAKFPLIPLPEDRVAIFSRDIHHQALEQLNSNVMIRLLKHHGVSYNSTV